MLKLLCLKKCIENVRIKTQVEIVVIVAQWKLAPQIECSTHPGDIFPISIWKTTCDPCCQCVGGIPQTRRKQEHTHLYISCLPVPSVHCNLTAKTRSLTSSAQPIPGGMPVPSQIKWERKKSWQIHNWKINFDKVILRPQMWDKQGLVFLTQIFWLWFQMHSQQHPPNLKNCSSAVIVELHWHVTHLSYCPDGVRVTSGWVMLAIWGPLQGGTWVGRHPEGSVTAWCAAIVFQSPR